jgi:tripartite-type tricarboxylate transporter receptor subunit TctC
MQLVIRDSRRKMKKMLRLIIGACVIAVGIPAVAQSYPTRPIRILVPFARGWRTGSRRIGCSWGGDGAQPPGLMARFKSIVARIVCAAVVASALPVVAQTYPTRPIRILVPFAPGGVGDLTARVVTQKMGESFGQQIIVDNRPSAGGIVASEIVAKAEPDGYTILLLNNLHAVSPSLFKSLPYDSVKDFAPVSTLGAFSLVFIVSPDSPIKSIKDLIGSAKANPGKLNMGTINIGATQNLAAELFKSMAGLDLVVVPFNSTAAVVTGLRGNNVQVAVEVLAPVIGQIRASALRAIAVTTPKRFAGLPDVPTVLESGVPGYEVIAWNGIGVPAKTPRAIIDRLNKAMLAALASPEVKQRFQELGVEARPSTPEAFHKFLVSEIAKWKAVTEKARIPKQ